MHTFTFRIDQITWHLDGQKVLTLTELPTRIGAKFHPDPVHRMASIQISTFGGDLNQYQLGQIVEMKMSIVTLDVVADFCQRDAVRSSIVTGDDSNRVPTADDRPMYLGPFASSLMRNK